ncbi:DNA replication/repair protein RecF [Bifidobacterium simiarum]|uniref:DNA replication and repair protein RecF n=1 Tax=Bifidobacterium simiarum TaxID=2045441 RepID=A0A2M9HCF4_9BIFI|nr:AAA family ATPase [Bifidobacterium simiarum]PJM74500.1 DNA replication and repair protein RecF [Bifidobacterium simiarum]
MFVSRLALDDFRSWQQMVIDFVPGLNLLFGANGLGKTNIVEALEVLSTGGSHRTSSSAPLVRAGARKATVRANVDDDGSVTTYEVSIPVRGANRARINSGKSLYMRDVVGRVPTVVFAPEDQRLIAAEPAARRGFVNQSASQLILGYYDVLQRFNQTGRQRAALLKQIQQQRVGSDARMGSDVSAASFPTSAGSSGLSSADTPTDIGLPAYDPMAAALSGLEVWTGQFIEAGVELTRLRQRFIDMLNGPFARIYRELAGPRHHAELVYAPSFDEVTAYGDHDGHEDGEGGLLAYDPQSQRGDGDCSDLVTDSPDDQIRMAISRHFQRIYPGEVAQARNLIGPHRDDVIVRLNGMNARDYASNGEMWTLALAMKMALFEVIKAERGDDPILILDDVFAQLDESRRRQIVDFASRQSQVLITMAAESDMPQGLDAHRIDVADIVAAQDAQEAQYAQEAQKSQEAQA